ncbi:MAG: GNAT family N-acetyltransferase [Clostridiales bacterium]|nr:GNAT family N-acetyltransferase [Clostridiales bacterium]
MTQKEQSLFPADSVIIEKMDGFDESGLYYFSMSNIAEKRAVAQKTKNGEQLFFYRTKTRIKTFLSGQQNFKCTYYIVNSDGEIVARLPATLNSESSSIASLDYWIKEKFRNQGIGSVMLQAVVKDLLLETKPLDNQPFSSIKEPDVDKSCVTTIILDISENNKASKRIAEKNGFIQTASDTYQITIAQLQKFLQPEKEMIK